MAIYGTLAGQDSTTTGYSSIQPTLDLNFAKVKLLDPRITFYRDSLATYTDSLGIIRTVPANTPRFDHNPTTGESLGLLIEESRTNLIPNSYGNAGLYLTGFATNIGIAPDGTNTASKVTPNSGTSGGTTVVHQNAGITLNGAYTYSVFVKPLVSSWQFQLVDNNNASGAPITVTLDANGNASATGQDTNTTTQIYPNGWVRIIFTYTATDTATNYLQLYSNGYGTGDGNLKAYLLWGVQYESGGFATSYIPTTTASVTRAVDVCYIDGTNFSNWYNSVEGSYFIDFNLKNTSTSDIVILSSPVTSGRYPWLLYRFTEDYWKYYNGVNGVAHISTGTTFSSQNKFCISYSSSQGSVSKDGILTLSNNSEISVGSGINANSIKIFSGSTINEFPPSGTIKRFTYYPKRLTNTQLQNLTA